MGGALQSRTFLHVVTAFVVRLRQAAHKGIISLSLPLCGLCGYKIVKPVLFCLLVSSLLCVRTHSSTKVSNARHLGYLSSATHQSPLLPHNGFPPCFPPLFFIIFLPERPRATNPLKISCCCTDPGERSKPEQKLVP